MRKILLVISVVLAVAIPFSVFAATSDTPAAQAVRGFCGIDTSKLTQQQIEDLNSEYKKMMDLRKETINKLVEDGAITKDQGEAAVERIDEMIKYHQENGFNGGCGMGRGFGGGGRGMGRGFGGNCIFDTTTN